MEQVIAMIFWLGQASFVIQTPETTILTDPFNAQLGYEVKKVEGVDIVTVSHEHGDHNNVAMAAGQPTVLRGLESAGGRETKFNSFDKKIGDVHVQSVTSYHDEAKGAKRGKNIIFVFEIQSVEPPVRVVHMGDFGEERLSEAQRKAIGRVDVLMLPVGGFYTIDAARANQVLADLKPKICIPMHWKTEKTERLPIKDSAPFLEGKKNILRDGAASGNRLALTRSLLDRAAKAGEPLIVPLEFGPPPGPRPKKR